MSKLTWSEHKVRLKDLKEYEHNPRQISKAYYKKLVKSLKENGYNSRILCDVDDVIISGHMRTKCLREAGFRDNDILHVLKPNRKLTQEEFKRINIQDNVSFGDWDLDQITSSFDLEDLMDWGIDESLFKDLMHDDKEQVVKSKEPIVPESKTCPNCGFDL